MCASAMVNRVPRNSAVPDCTILTMTEQRQPFTETHSPPSRDLLLQRRIGDLRLRLQGTRLERLVERLYGELAEVGVSFRPTVYLSDDWGCPDRIPIIGVPFYLADVQLTRLEDELMEGIEAESDDQIMRYLRHEAGHALNYAYRLYDTPDWTAHFGPFTRPYSEEYSTNPFSRSFVRHLPGWYAQKHPDEDFAETFAVWLNPESSWREVYADWPCLTKLQYLDNLAGHIGAVPPPVTAENYDTQEEFLTSTLAEYYENRHGPAVQIPRVFDNALRDIFPLLSGSTASQGAAEFVRKHRRKVVSTVFYWTGLDDSWVRGLLNHLEERCQALKLQVVEGESSDKIIEMVVFVTTLCINRVRTGEFMGK